MSKYEPLKDYLIATAQKEITLSFFEIEQIIEQLLPKSATVHRAWWANGGHSQAEAWLGAGYKVVNVDFETKEVFFDRIKLSAEEVWLNQKEEQNNFARDTETHANIIEVCDYEFVFLQKLIPEQDRNGHIKKYFPQEKYKNKKGLKLSCYGNGAFCKFAIVADDEPGVYLWVVNGKIIYIGETENIQKRFNLGYGNISPRNCYEGGQSTNCKMNKVVLDLYEQGILISVYFHRSIAYKHIEKELLRKIKTPYNTKNNK